MGHLHIHIPHRSLSIQHELNNFLRLDNISIELIVEILNKIKKYLNFFMESYSKIFLEAINNISYNNLTDSIASLQRCLEELDFHNSYLIEIYEVTYIEHYDALKCFPLCEFVIKKIIHYCLDIHKKSLIN